MDEPPAGLAVPRQAMPGCRAVPVCFSCSTPQFQHSWGVWRVHSTYMADTEVLEQHSAWLRERTFTSQSVTKATAVLCLGSSTCQGSLPKMREQCSVPVPCLESWRVCASLIQKQIVGKILGSQNPRMGLGWKGP